MEFICMVLPSKSALVTLPRFLGRLYTKHGKGALFSIQPGYIPQLHLLHVKNAGEKITFH